MSLKSVNRAVSPTKRALRTYRSQVRTLLLGHFALTNESMTEGDRIWNEWAGLIGKEKKLNPSAGNRDQDFAKLAALLFNHSLADQFIARVLAVLSAPTLGQSPFLYPTEWVQYSYASNWFYPFPKGLSSENLIERIGEFPIRVQRFFWDLLKLNLETVDWDSGCGMKEPADPDLPINDRNIAYNRLILRALQALTPREHELSYWFSERYEMKLEGRWFPLWFTDPAHYQPFVEILVAPVPDQWKERADHQRRVAIIVERERNMEFPEKDGHAWKRFLRQYVHEIQDACNKGLVPLTLLGSQFEWILEILEETEAPPFFFSWDSWNSFMPRLRRLPDRTILYRYVRHMAFAIQRYQKDGYLMVTSETEGDAQAVLREFGPIDPELAKILEDALVKYSTVCSESGKRSLKIREAVEAMYK